MYKFTNQLSYPKLILVRRQLSDGSSAALIVLRRTQRPYSTSQESCPPPPPVKKTYRLFWSAVGATVLTGAAVVYAKNNPKARYWLENNVPIANDFIALVYQENTTYFKTFARTFDKSTTWVGNFLFGKEGVTPQHIKTRAEQDIEKDAAELFTVPKEYSLPPPSLEPLYVEEKVLDPPQVINDATVVQTDICEPEPVPVIKITKDMVELEHEMHENTKAAIDKYKLATKYSADYNKALYRIIESPLEDLDTKAFKALQGNQTNREASNKEAKEAAAKARLAIESLDRMISAGVQAPPESIAQMSRYIKIFRKDLDNAEKEFKLEAEKAVISERYWNKVEEARGTFKDELQALYPGIDICAKKLEIKGDTELFLIYMLKRIQYLQNQLAEMQTIREFKINQAIECHDEKALIDAKVEHLIKAQSLEKEKLFLKKWLELQAQANRETKEQLKKQYEIQQEVMMDRLARKEKEILASYNRTVYEKVEQERVQFKKELAAMAGKLQAMEQTLKKRAAAEAEARRSQSLWAAAEALLAATRRNSSETKVDHELKALEKAGKDDKLVQTVLKGINPEVLEKGIATEKSLRERFEKMEKTAVKVALIGREGASLPVYFLSWLQSKLMFQKFAEIPEEELKNQPVDFTKLDTFDIMHRARYHMDHGNLTAALRYINLLQGAPRAASKSWADEARKHLEIKQAAEAVMAHAYHMDHGNLTAALRYINLLQGAPRAASKSWADEARKHLEIKQAAEAVMAHASVSGILYL